MPVSLIIGISGQDGTYLAEQMHAQGYEVVGTTRDVKQTAEKFATTLLNSVRLAYWDLQDYSQLVNILLEYHPTEIYNFSAYTSGAGMYNDPISITKINGLAVTLILEAIREVDASIRFCQASSSELFGDTDTSPQSELTRFNPRSPYGAAKLYAHNMINIYRQRYGIFACSAILYNHESPRRGIEFVTRKISFTVAQIKLGLVKELNLGNLEACRDWGYAGDTVNAMSLMLRQNEAEDFVIATGITHSVRDFCETAFSFLGLNYFDYVKEDISMLRSSERCQLVGNKEKAERILKWKPTVDFQELIHMMVKADLQELSKNT